MLKNFQWLVIILICCITTLIISGCFGQKEQYPSGKDTVESYGDGMYQIFRHSDKTLGLVNVEISTGIEDKIYKYKKIDDKLYVYGGKGYTVLNISTFQIRQYTTFEGYTEAEIKQYKQFSEPNINRSIGNKYTKIEKFENFTKEERGAFGEIKQ